MIQAVVWWSHICYRIRGFQCVRIWVFQFMLSEMSQVAKNRFDGELGIMLLKFDKDTLSFAVKSANKDARSTTSTPS